MSCATDHNGTSNIDEGHLSHRDAEAVSHSETTDDLVRKGRSIEQRVLSRAVMYHVQDRVFIKAGKTVVYRDWSMASIISGTATAEQLMADLAHDVSNYTQSHGAPPTLAAMLVGDDPASDIYVRRKIEQCRKNRMRSLEHRYGADCTEAELLALIAQLNADPTVHGILVQLPLPKQIDSAKVLDTIDPAKDVDGFHPVNEIGRAHV